MANHIDLSSNELDPSATLQFIMAHTTKRPSENILFKVSPATFALHRQGWNPQYVRVTQKEADEMNAFLGHTWSIHDYAMGDRFKGSDCSRVVTFYDVFQAGRKRHGDEHMKRILAGGEHHLQVAKLGQTVEIECTSCRKLNVLSCHTNYYSSSYCYA